MREPSTGNRWSGRRDSPSASGGSLRPSAREESDAGLRQIPCQRQRICTCSCPTGWCLAQRRDSFPIGLVSLLLYWLPLQPECRYVLFLTFFVESWRERVYGGVVTSPAVDAQLAFVIDVCF